MELHRPYGEFTARASIGELIIGIESYISCAKPDELSLYYARCLESAAKDIRIKLELPEKR
jgi:hypothetical protein